MWSNILVPNACFKLEKGKQRAWESRSKWSPAAPLPHLVFKSGLQFCSGSAGVFGGIIRPSHFMACNKPFFAPNSNVLVCLASLCVGPPNLH